MITLALAYLRDRPLTTALNVLLLAISVAMLVLLLQLGTQASERFDRDARGIDLVVGAKGSPLQLILSSVFHIDQPTGNIPLSARTLLERDPAVAKVVPLALGDNFRGYGIVGTDKGFAALYGTRLAAGRAFSAPMEAVIGAEVARATGAGLGQKFIGSHGLGEDEDGAQGHDHAPFAVVGILAPTGGVADRLILTSVESVWSVHGIGADGHDGETDHVDSAGHTHEHEEDVPAPLQAQTGAQRLEPEYTALLVTYRSAAGALRIPSMINRQSALQATVPATETARLLDLVGASIEGIRIFAWLLAATGGLAILVALVGMVRNREGDLALLRVMGASRRQVFGTVMLEGVVTALAGALAGWGGRACAHHGRAGELPDPCGARPFALARASRRIRPGRRRDRHRRTGCVGPGAARLQPRSRPRARAGQLTMTREDLADMSWKATLLILAAVISVNAAQAITAAVEGTKRDAAVVQEAKQTYSAAQAPDYKSGREVEDVWKPAATPKGGVSWKVLESTGETTRKDAQGYIVAKPKFTPQVKALAGKRITVAGWMMPLSAGRTQKHFVLLGYPPGCPFHFHAAPNQFIEVYADTPFPTSETRVFTVSGVLELTGYDESGIFYRLRQAKPG